MGRRCSALLVAILLLLLLVAPASAADGCPAASSGFRAGAVNWGWQAGDPIPSGDFLWEETVLAGLAAEGLTLEDALAIFGVGTAADLYGLVLEGWRGLDVNLDGTICFKSYPEGQNVWPAYYSNFIDNNARGVRYAAISIAGWRGSVATLG
jgi:hypothetical protein